VTVLSLDCHDAEVSSFKHRGIEVCEGVGEVIERATENPQVIGVAQVGGQSNLSGLVLHIPAEI